LKKKLAEKEAAKKLAPANKGCDSLSCLSISSESIKRLNLDIENNNAAYM